MPLCLFSGFLRHKKEKQEEEEEEEGRGERRAKKKIYKYLHSSILRGAEEKHDKEIDELERQQPVRKRKSTTGETNDRQTKHKRTQALLFCPLSNPNSSFLHFYCRPCL
jgi:hypothetical protein